MGTVLPITHKQDLDARDKRLDGMRDANSLLQAKIKELEAGQQALALAITSKPPQEDSQGHSQENSPLSTQMTIPLTQTVQKKRSTKPPAPSELICPYCGNQTKFTKRGFDERRKRRWKCGACKRSFVEDASGVAVTSSSDLEEGEISVDK